MNLHLREGLEGWLAVERIQRADCREIDTGVPCAVGGIWYSNLVFQGLLPGSPVSMGCKYGGQNEKHA